MPFPFTFSLSVPGLSNPFSTARRSAQAIPTPATDHHTDSSRHGAGKHPPVQKKLPITRRRPSPVPSSPSPAAPLSRKRGWEPTFAEPSRSTATLASTSGYLDTPAKYREMAASRNASADEFHEVEMFVDDTELPPPAKRRRGLAGSIVSTALSAALIGTAVGLTVYRLWRDRGKESPRLEAEHQHTQQPPPPPYQQGEWTASPVSASPPPVQVTPATPRTIRRARHPVASAGKRTPRHTNTNTNTRTRNHGVHHASPPPPPFATMFPPAQPEFEFAPEQQQQQGGGGVEDQMDWIGDKLSMLIEEGKRALGREVVVMSDAKEDEVDDGSGAWEEEDPSTVSRSRSRSGSIRRAKRPRSLAPSSSSAHGFYGHSSPSVSPRSPGFFGSGCGMSTSMSTPQMITPARRPQTTHSRGGSAEVGSFREDERAWESPEMRESMERARMRVMFMGRRGD